MKRTTSISVVCITFICLLIGCGKGDTNGYNSTPPPGGSGSGTDISIYHMAFSPASKTVAKGTVVKWTNNDGYPHTVTANDGTTFDSGNLTAGASFSYTANTPGTFNYHCTIHGLTMAGILIVNP